MAEFDDDKLDPDQLETDQLDPAELEGAARALGTSDPQQDVLGREMREMVETVGLVAYGLDPVEPGAEVRDRLLERLGLGPEESSLLRRQAIPFPQAAPATASPWLRLAVAAAISVALALAAVSGLLYRRLHSQEQQLARLERELAGVSAQTSAQVRAELLRLREHFTLVTAPETSICRLEPTDPSQEGASGAVYMNPSQRRWVLTANNLEPTAGLRYQIWFVTAEGAVWVGSFEVGAQQSFVEIGNGNLPSNPTAVMITLEPAAVAGEPKGPTVLYGEERAEML